MNDESYVVVIGSSNMDLVIYSEKLPRSGETVTGGTFEQHLGGKGANQALASTRAGSKTYFIAKIGKDDFGDHMVSKLLKEGIYIEYLIRTDENPSGIAFIMVDKNGENMISVAPGANALLKPEELDQISDLIKNATIILVQMEIPTETISQIFKIASEGKPLKILNPAPLKKIPLNILSLIDIIIPNQGELFQLNRLYNLGDFEKEDKNILIASKNLVSLGPKIVITTLGSKGCKIYQSETDDIIQIDAPRVNAVDTVGAGDSFNGILASFLSKGEKLINAVKYAVVGASIAVTRKGAQDSMPDLNEIEEKYKTIFLND
jgi:ribokinase